MSLFSFPEVDAGDYRFAAPFPHIYIDNAWHQPTLDACARDVAGFQQWDGEKQFFGARQKRHCGNIAVMPASVVDIISAASTPRFIAWLEAMTGERELHCDPYLEGAGIHSIGTGGFLKIHADFNWHARLQLYRRLNLLIYLNDGWQAAWDGCIELFADPKQDPEVSLLPVMNRMLIFTTDDASFHGHRRPLACPEDIRRNSIALYYDSPIQPDSNFAKARTDSIYRTRAFERFDVPLRQRLGRLVKAVTG